MNEIQKLKTTIKRRDNTIKSLKAELKNLENESKLQLSFIKTLKVQRGDFLLSLIIGAYSPLAGVGA